MDPDIDRVAVEIARAFRPSGLAGVVALRRAADWIEAHERRADRGRHGEVARGIRLAIACDLRSGMSVEEAATKWDVHVARVRVIQRAEV